MSSEKKITDSAKDIDFSTLSTDIERLRRIGAPRSRSQPAILTHFLEINSPMAIENRNLKNLVDILTVATVEWKNKNIQLEAENIKLQAEKIELSKKLSELDVSNIVK